jgi:hypothetical protein
MLKTDQICSSKTSVHFYQTTRVTFQNTVQCGRVFSEFQIVRYKKMSKVSLYAQMLK